MVCIRNTVRELTEHGDVCGCSLFSIKDAVRRRRRSSSQRQWYRSIFLWPSWPSCTRWQWGLCSSNWKNSVAWPSLTVDDLDQPVCSVISLPRHIPAYNYRQQQQQQQQ